MKWQSNNAARHKGLQDKVDTVSPVKLKPHGLVSSVFVGLQSHKNPSSNQRRLTSKKDSRENISFSDFLFGGLIYLLYLNSSLNTSFQVPQLHLVLPTSFSPNFASSHSRLKTSLAGRSSSIRTK